MTISDRFKMFDNIDLFSLLDKTHILKFFIGIDDKGRKCIELRTGKFKAQKISNTSCIEISQLRYDDYYCLRFSLTDNDMTGLFYTFCEDLAEQTRDVPVEADGLKAVIKRYNQWRKMFIPVKSKMLSEHEIMGLIGELLFLKDFLAKKYGFSDSLSSWSGQDLTHKDFSFRDTWYEVKAISSGSQNVSISSLEQLDSKGDGELVVYSLEKMSSGFNGITLNKLIADIVTSITQDDLMNEFRTKISKQGYRYSEYYDEFVFTVIGSHRFLVSEDFPKLTPESVPKAVAKAKYSLALTEIRAFEIKP